MLGTISGIESVHDGWVAICNLNFLNSLDPQTKTQFLDAFKEVGLAQIKLYQKSIGFCIDEFKKLGATIYTPTLAEINVLSEKFGHTHPSWTPIKKKLLGEDGESIFDSFLKSAVG